MQVCEAVVRRGQRGEAVAGRLNGLALHCSAIPIIAAVQTFGLGEGFASMLNPSVCV